MEEQYIVPSLDHIHVVEKTHLQTFPGLNLMEHIKNDLEKKDG